MGTSVLVHPGFDQLLDNRSGGKMASPKLMLLVVVSGLVATAASSPGPKATPFSKILLVKTPSELDTREKREAVPGDLIKGVINGIFGTKKAKVHRPKYKRPKTHPHVVHPHHTYSHSHYPRHYH